MGKKSKNEAAKQSNGIVETSSPKATTPKPRRRKVESGVKTPRPRKSAAPQATPTASGASIHSPSDDEIRLRAYFIAERRVQLGLDGDSTHDWIEARRQLIEEARKRSSEGGND